VKQAVDWKKVQCISIAILKIVTFSSRNSTIITAINFKALLIKFCRNIVVFFSIISCKLCLNQLRFSYFIMKHVEVKFFTGHTLGVATDTLLV